MTAKKWEERRKWDAPLENTIQKWQIKLFEIKAIMNDLVDILFYV